MKKIKVEQDKQDKKKKKQEFVCFYKSVWNFLDKTEKELKDKVVIMKKIRHNPLVGCYDVYHDISSIELLEDKIKDIKKVYSYLIMEFEKSDKGKK